MSWKLLIRKEAEEDLTWFRKHDKSLYTKCFDLLRSIAIDPYNGIGKPEKLKYMEQNIWSRRVNLEHRCVYIVWDEDKEIDILVFKQHYNWIN